MDNEKLLTEPRIEGADTQEIDGAADNNIQITRSPEEVKARVTERVETLGASFLVSQETRTRIAEIIEDFVASELGYEREVFEFSDSDEETNFLNNIVRGIANVFRLEVATKMANMVGHLMFEERLARALDGDLHPIRINIELPQDLAAEFPNLDTLNVDELLAFAHYLNRNANFEGELEVRRVLSKRDFPFAAQMMNMLDATFCYEKIGKIHDALALAHQVLEMILSESSGTPPNTALLFQAQHKVYRLRKKLNIGINFQEAIAFYVGYAEDERATTGQRAAACTALKDLYSRIGNNDEAKRCAEMGDEFLRKINAHIRPYFNNTEARMASPPEQLDIGTIEEASERRGVLTMAQLIRWSIRAKDAGDISRRILFIEEILQRPDLDKGERMRNLTILSYALREVGSIQKERDILAQIVACLEGTDEPGLPVAQARLESIDRQLKENETHTVEDAIENREQLTVDMLVKWAKIADEERNTEARITLGREIITRRETRPKLMIFNLKLLSILYEQQGNLREAVSFAEQLFEYQRGQGDDRLELTTHRIESLQVRIRRGGNWDRPPHERSGTPEHMRVRRGLPQASQRDSQRSRAPGRYDGQPPTARAVSIPQAEPVQRAAVVAERAEPVVITVPTPVRETITPRQELVNWLTTFKSRPGKVKIVDGHMQIAEEERGELLRQLTQIFKNKDIIVADAGDGRLAGMLGKLDQAIKDGKIKGKFIDQILEILG